VAAAFTHRDSRAGDPDLHTHVAVANKVQTLDGRWLSIDGRVLFKATVAASETYNTALEHHLRDRLLMRDAGRWGSCSRIRGVPRRAGGWFGDARRVVENQATRHAPAVPHPRPLRRTRALLAVPGVVLRHRIRHWISHADRP